MLINHIMNMNAQLSHSYINLVVSCLFHFFEMNDIVLNKRKIKFIGEYRKMHTDRAYTDKEIKKLVDAGAISRVTLFSIKKSIKKESYDWYRLYQ